MMQAPDFAVNAAREHLQAEDFAVEGHGILFDIISTRHHDGLPVEIVSIMQVLYDRGLIDKLGGAATVTEIYTAAPNPAHAGHYAQVVREKSTLRRILRGLIKAEASVLSEPEQWRGHVATLMDTLVTETALPEGRGGIQILRDILFQVTDDIEQAYHNRGHVTRGIPTGFTDLDRLCLGLERGENIVIGGATGMGKSAFAVNILEKMALAEGDYVEFYKHNQIGGEPLYPKRRVLIVTLEMTGFQIAQRMLMGRAAIQMGRVRDGMLSKVEFADLGKTAAKLCDTQFHIWDAAGLDIVDLESRLKDFKQRHPDLDAVAVDHCGLLRARAVRDSGNPTAVVAHVSPRLKALWKTIDVVGFTLWQLNRAASKSADTKPKLANLKDSGAIENDADRVIFPYRPAYGKYLEDEEEFQRAQSEAFLIVAKNRGGPTGELPVKWYGQFTRFESVTSRLLSNNKDQHQPGT
jgi:replicative DNA helicase